MPPGYSGKSLVDKLGLKSGMRAIFVHAPAGYENTLGALPDGIELRSRPTGSFDFIHVFATRTSQLQREIVRLRALLKDEGMLWVSWPKKTSKLDSEITEGDVRRAGLSLGKGLVDVKVCAVDEDWSGLKFMIRREQRRRRPPR